MANHIIRYHDDSQRAKVGKKAVPATKSWATCSCGQKTLPHRGGLDKTRRSLSQWAKTHMAV